MRRERLIVVLRRVAPAERLVELVLSLADAGARIFEVTFDAPTAATDLVACREAACPCAPDACLVGAGTIRTLAALDSGIRRRRAVRRQPAARPAIVGGGSPPRRAGHPGRLHADRGRRRVAGRRHVREAVPRVVGWTGATSASSAAPMPEIELIPTGGDRRVQRAGLLPPGASAVGSRLARSSTPRRRDGRRSSPRSVERRRCRSREPPRRPRVCLVTGSTGIAAASAELFAAEGAAVFVTSRNGRSRPGAGRTRITRHGRPRPTVVDRGADRPGLAVAVRRRRLRRAGSEGSTGLVLRRGAAGRPVRRRTDRTPLDARRLGSRRSR